MILDLPWKQAHHTGSKRELQEVADESTANPCAVTFLLWLSATRHPHRGDALANAAILVNVAGDNSFFSRCRGTLHR